MTIRVELFAQDAVAASSIVEFALSMGAVLQSYSMVEAPQSVVTTKPTQKRFATGFRVVDINKPVQKDSARGKLLQYLVEHHGQGKSFTPDSLKRMAVICLHNKKTATGAIAGLVKVGVLERIYG